AVPRDADIIVVHDAVRPLITRGLIDAVVAAVAESGAAICALPITETIKRVHQDVVQTTLDRSELWAVQTPQAFRAALLREAHEKARRDGVVGTDDAMLVERLGHAVRVVRGLVENVKITTAEDLRRARGARGRGRASASDSTCIRSRGGGHWCSGESPSSSIAASPVPPTPTCCRTRSARRCWARWRWVIWAGISPTPTRATVASRASRCCGTWSSW